MVLGKIGSRFPAPLRALDAQKFKALSFDLKI